MTTTPTPEEILRRIWDSAERDQPDEVHGVPVPEIRAALGIKPPGPPPAQYSGEGGHNLRLEDCCLDDWNIWIGLDGGPGAHLARPEVLRLWADLGEWLKPTEGECDGWVWTENEKHGIRMVINGEHFGTSALGLHHRLFNQPRIDAHLSELARRIGARQTLAEGEKAPPLKPKRNDL